MSCSPLTGSYINKVERLFIPPSFGFGVAFTCSHDCTRLLYLTSLKVTLSVTFLVRACVVTWSHLTLHVQLITPSNEQCTLHGLIIKAHEGHKAMCSKHSKFNMTSVNVVT